MGLYYLDLQFLAWILRVIDRWLNERKKKKEKKKTLFSSLLCREVWKKFTVHFNLWLGQRTQWVVVVQKTFTSRVRTENHDSLESASYTVLSTQFFIFQKMASRTADSTFSRWNLENLNGACLLGPTSKLEAWSLMIREWSPPLTGNNRVVITPGHETGPWCNINIFGSPRLFTFAVSEYSELVGVQTKQYMGC